MDPVLLSLSAAFFTGLLASFLKMPPLVGYLVAGYGLCALEYPVTPLLSELAEVGILLLLFTVGLKLKLETLIKREVFGVGGLHILIVALVSGSVFFLQSLHLTGGLLLGVALAFSSTVLAVKVLEDNGEIQTFQGRTVLGILILQDVVAVGLLVLAGGDVPSPWALALLGIPVLAPLARRFYDITANDELRLLLGVLMAVVGGEIASQLGVSRELGALLMGVLLSSHPDAKDLSDKLWGLKEMFLVGFFLEIGLHGIPTLAQGERALLLLAALPLQGILFFFLMIVLGLRARTSFIAALALSTYSEFALIVSEPLIHLGLLDSDWDEVLGLAVAGSLALGAVLNRWPQSIYAVLEPLLKPLERSVPHPDQIPPDFGQADWLIVGMGRTGRAAYRALDERNTRIMGIDADPIRVRQLKTDGIRVVYGDVEDAELWAHAPLDAFRGIIIAMPGMESRVKALESIRARGFKGVVGTVSFRSSEHAILLKLGADEVYRPLSQAGEQLAEHLLELEQELLAKKTLAEKELPDLSTPHGATEFAQG
jgi:glutathione-regulated potassium-efflux system ancillary protein KefC